MPNNYNPFPGRFGRATATEMKALFDLRETDNLPPEGRPAKIYNGIAIWIAPLAGDAPKHGRRMSHRMRARCPKCGEDVSASRLWQHLPTHDRAINPNELD